MLSGNRYAYFALGLVAGLGFSLLFLVWAVPEFRGSYPVGEAANQQTDDSQSSSAASDKQSNEPQWRYWSRRLVATEDTLAQWVMAAFGVVATIVSVFAVILLRDTLHATREAVRSADDAVALTRLMGEAQIRAYISVNTLAILNFTNDSFQVGMTVTNIGQTPAKHFKIWAQIFYKRRPDSDPIWLTINKRQSVTEIGTNTPVEVRVPTQTLPLGVTREEILNGSWAIVLAGKYSYRDVFGKRRRGVFRYFLNPSQLDAKGYATVTSASKHNRSS